MFMTVTLPVLKPFLLKHVVLKITAAILFGGICKKTVTYNGTQYVLPSKINKEDGHGQSMSSFKKLYSRIYIFASSGPSG